MNTIKQGTQLDRAPYPAIHAPRPLIGVSLSDTHTSDIFSAPCVCTSCPPGLEGGGGATQDVQNGICGSCMDTLFEFVAHEEPESGQVLLACGRLLVLWPFSSHHDVYQGLRRDK